MVLNIRDKKWMRLLIIPHVRKWKLLWVFTLVELHSMTRQQNAISLEPYIWLCGYTTRMNINFHFSYLQLHVKHIPKLDKINVHQLLLISLLIFVTSRQTQAHTINSAWLKTNIKTYFYNSHNIIPMVYNLNPLTLISQTSFTTTPYLFAS